MAPPLLSSSSKDSDLNDPRTPSRRLLPPGSPGYQPPTAPYASTGMTLAEHLELTSASALSASKDEDDADAVSVWDVISSRTAPERISGALARRLKDFNFAQGKRRAYAGKAAPVGIMGIYDYIAGIRRDIEWAEDAAYRRSHDLPYLSWRDFELAKTSSLRNNPPIFTYALGAICVSLMIWEFSVNDWVVEPMGVNPMAGVSAETLIECGARVTPLIITGQAWRLVTPLFLHSGIIHLVFNMMVLLFVGRGLEKAHGTAAAAGYFLIGGYGGNVLSALFLPQFISVGASGGIFAMLGACIADIVMNWELVFSSNAVLQTAEQKRGHKWILVWLVVDVIFNVIIGLCPYVDNFCHVGGMIFGFLLAWGSMSRISFAFFDIRHGWFKRGRKLVLKAWSLLLAGALLIAATVCLFVFSNGYTSPCNGCRFASCIPFPFWGSSRWWHCDDCYTAYGSATYAEDVGYYSVDLVCPSTEQVTFDIEPTWSVDDLNAALPGYCREQCGSGVYRVWDGNHELNADAEGQVD